MGKLYGGILIYQNWKATKFGQIDELRKQEAELAELEKAAREEERVKLRQEAADRGEDLDVFDREWAIKVAMEEGENEEGEEGEGGVADGSGGDKTVGGGQDMQDHHRYPDNGGEYYEDNEYYDQDGRMG